jgi:hypothetical protein
VNPDLNFPNDNWDETFVRKTQILPDRSILYAGDGWFGPAIGRLLEDGTPAPDFYTHHELSNDYDASPPRILDFARLASGEIVVVGSFTEWNDQPRNGVALLSPDGYLSFNGIGSGSGFDGPAYAVEVDENDRIYIAGDFGNFRGNPVGKIIRIHPYGEIDGKFTTRADATDGAVKQIQLVRISGQDFLYAAGEFDRFDGRNADEGLVRITSSGRSDFDFQFAGYDRTERFLVLEDGNLIVGSAFGELNKYDADGHRFDYDSFHSFYYGGGEINALEADAEGNIYIGLQDGDRGSLQRIKPDGREDIFFQLPHPPRGISPAPLKA